jgi:hypothetical protein|tara:strand:+ start:9012 stop:11801 length:2790 start_codon:yes stop_codon:yes gene_type:complete
MANAYSILDGVTEYIPPTDLQFMQGALAFKQNKFDTNQAAIQDLYDRTISLDLMKDQDKDYLKSKLNNLVDDINSGDGDISDPNLSRRIGSHLKQALDKNVMNAASSTLAARKLLSDIDKAKERNDGSYAAQNDMFATRGLRNWKNDGDVGSQYGGGSYVNYQDYQGKMAKILSDPRKFAEEYGYQQKYGANGLYFLDVDGERVSKDKIASIVQTNLGQQDRMQMQIDGWAKFGGDDATKAAEAYTTYSKTLEDRQTTTVANAEIAFTLNDSDENEQILNSHKLTLETMVSNKEEMLKNPSESRANMQTMMIEGEFMNNITNAYSYDSRKEKLKANNVALTLLKINADKKNTQSIIDNQNGVYSQAVNTEGKNDNPLDNIEAEDTKQAEVVANLNNALINSFDDESKATLMAAYSTDGVFDSDKFNEAVLSGEEDISGYSSRKGVDGSRIYNSLRVALLQKQGTESALSTRLNYGLDAYEAQKVNKLAQVGVENPSIKIMYKGEMTSIADIAEKKGVYNPATTAGFVGGAIEDVLRSPVDLVRGIGNLLDGDESTGFKDRFGTTLREGEQAGETNIDKLLSGTDGIEIKKGLLQALHSSMLAQDSRFNTKEEKAVYRQRLLKHTNNDEALADKLIEHYKKNDDTWHYTSYGFDDTFSEDNTSENIADEMIEGARALGNTSAVQSGTYMLPQDFKHDMNVNSPLGQYLIRTSSTDFKLPTGKDARVTLTFNKDATEFRVFKNIAATSKIDEYAKPSEWRKVTPELASSVAVPKREVMHASTHTKPVKLGKSALYASDSREVEEDPNGKGQFVTSNVIHSYKKAAPQLFNKYQNLEGVMNKVLNSDRLETSIQSNGKDMWFYTVSKKGGGKLFEKRVLDSDGQPTQFIDNYLERAVAFPQDIIMKYLNATMLELERGTTQEHYDKLIKLYN